MEAQVFSLLLLLLLIGICCLAAFAIQKLHEWEDDY